MSQNDFNFLDRELCANGACIGLIGPDGRCKECGLPSATSTQHPRHRGMVLGAMDDDQRDGSDADGFESGERELCPDGACVGVIGPDGRCKECGTPGRRSGGRRGATMADELETHAGKGDRAADPDDFESRQLCPDGSCIGLIGDDGRCKECGMRPSGPC